MNGVLDFVGFFLYLVYRVVMIPIVTVLYLFLFLTHVYSLTGQMLNYAPKLVKEVRLQLYAIKPQFHFKRKTVARVFSH